MVERVRWPEHKNGAGEPFKYDVGRGADKRAYRTPRRTSDVSQLIAPAGGHVGGHIEDDDRHGGEASEHYDFPFEGGKD